MYASDRQLDIACDKRKLPMVLDFAVRLHNKDIFTRNDGRFKMAFAIVPSESEEQDVYLVGTGTMAPYETGSKKGWAEKPGKGWTDYQFDYDHEIVARIISQWAMAQKLDTCPEDEAYEQGIRVMSIPTACENGILPEPYSIENLDMGHARLAFVPYLLTYEE